MSDSVFDIACPFNDESGKAAWEDAIEEWIHGDFDLKLSTERNIEGFPKTTIDEWEQDLGTGKLWNTWFDMTKEEELPDLSDYDLKPLQLAFANLALTKLAAVREEFGVHS